MNEDRETSLKKLMLSSMDGDQEAYKLFLKEMSLLVKAYLSKRCAHLGSDRIDDLIQEVLMAIHLKRSTYRTDLPVLPWIFTITRHKLIDEVRSINRKTKNDLQEYMEESFTTSQLEDQEEVELALAGLTQKQREMLFMAKVEEVPLSEIAEKFKMSLSAVKVSIHRAIKSVRR